MLRIHYIPWMTLGLVEYRTISLKQEYLVSLKDTASLNIVHSYFCKLVLVPTTHPGFLYDIDTEQFFLSIQIACDLEFFECLLVGIELDSLLNVLGRFRVIAQVSLGQRKVIKGVRVFGIQPNNLFQFR